MSVRQAFRVDVHAHFLPAFYREALAAAGHEKPDGMPAIPHWDEREALALMDELGIATALLSISSPGVHFGDDAAARALARRVNEEGARLGLAHPQRFGYFASLPLPDVEGSIVEARHALDRLHADGIVLYSNQGGLYLGDPALAPLYRELDARSAVIFVHPTSPACGCSERLDRTFPRPAFEFMFETTRSIVDMTMAGVLRDHPRLRVIVPHAGAALTGLAQRIEGMRRLFRCEGQGEPPSMVAAIRQLHFDLAGSPVPNLLRELLELADPDRIHYGSDYPFTSAPRAATLLAALESTPLLDDALRRKAMRGNSLRLFPRLGRE